MLIFIDESGDAGFELDKGASPIFVLAMIVFATREDAPNTRDAILRSAVWRTHKAEFRFNALLRRKLGSGAIAEVRFKDSKSDVLRQLADMCAGAIAESGLPDMTVYYPRSV